MPKQEHNIYVFGEHIQGGRRQSAGGSASAKAAEGSERPDSHEAGHLVSLLTPDDSLQNRCQSPTGI
jgi:hypothetical protein